MFLPDAGSTQAVIDSATSVGSNVGDACTRAILHWVVADERAATMMDGLGSRAGKSPKGAF